MSANDIQIPITLFDISTLAQVDTGATISVIPESLIPHNVKLDFYPNTVLTLQAYGGHQVPDAGFAYIPITISSKKMLFPCLITKTTGSRLLLGNDFLEYFSVIIDPIL